MCLTKVYDNPHQTTIIQSTPCVWHEHPETCLTDVLPEVVILVNQSNQGCYLLNSFVLVYVLVLFLVSHRYKKSVPLIPCILESWSSPNKPKHDTQGKGTPTKRRIPVSQRSCSYISFGDYLLSNLIRIFDTNSS